MKKRSSITIPNVISLLRLVISPIIPYLILTDQLFIGFVVYVLVALSDALDGYVARNFKQKSEAGGMLDALADRFLGIIVFVALVKVSLISGYVIWIFVAFALLELIIAAEITIKYGVFYLHLVHRNSIRYFAVFLFSVLGGYMLNIPQLTTILNYAMIISIPFAIYTFLDYMSYIQKHKKV
jgi:phosphatidylglycerophosphate synthase